MMEVKIGKFIKEHLPSMVEYANNNLYELNDLIDKKYCQDIFNIGYPVFKETEEIENGDKGILEPTKTIGYRYWKDIYTINDKKYRACSQWYDKHKENFLKYLKEKDILLDKYRGEEIFFFSDEKSKNNAKITNTMNTKNIILYGSPGVGKTHNTNKLINLIESGMSEKEIFENIQANEATDYETIDFKERVKFVTFHQSFGYEDFIEGFRPNEDGKIELVDGVLKTLSTTANKNHINSIKYDEYAKQDKKQEILFELFVESIQDKIDIDGKYSINDKVYIFETDNESFRYKGDNWQNSQKMKFKDIKLLNNFHAYTRKVIKKVPNISGLAKQHATYYSLIVNNLYQFLEQHSNDIDIDSIESEKQQNYYLVIDEINRGNISKIFGELITLIEEDKRDKLEVTLPYSKHSFKIPSNLYIIGTMNSTDKSIALIDIALRRRFTFLKMEPNAELITYPKAKAIFLKLNNKIIEKLGEDYQIGHSYFMNMAEEEDLEFVLKYKIEPLLEEYFYGDDDGLKEILRLIENSSDEEEGE